VRREEEVQRAGDRVRVFEDEGEQFAENLVVEVVNHVVLRGHGDPTLGAEDLTGLARQVASWGITRVTGAVLGDESWFDGVRTGPGWKSSFYVLESPPLSALVAERALYRGKTSHNPALAAASLFRQALAEAGVAVAKRSGVGRAGESSLPLAYDISTPLAGIVAQMETESDNFVAELLLKELGALAAGHGTTAGPPNGLPPSTEFTRSAEARFGPVRPIPN